MKAKISMITMESLTIMRNIRILEMQDSAKNVVDRHIFKEACCHMTMLKICRALSESKQLRYLETQ